MHLLHGPACKARGIAEMRLRMVRTTWQGERAPSLKLETTGYADSPESRGNR